MKNTLIAAGLITLLISGAGLFSNNVLADDDDFSKIDKKLSEAFDNARASANKNKLHESISIVGVGSDATTGKIRMTEANLDSISGANLMVSVWGMKFTVDTSKANIIGAGKTVNVSDMKVGDKLLINGEINRSTSLVTANQIFDRSLQRQAVTDIESRIKALLEQIKALQEEFKKSQQAN